MEAFDIARAYLPLVHYDRAETLPLRFIGYSVLTQSGQSPSFRRDIRVPEDAMCVIEYAYFWDYDIQHMYDLEHIWVTVGQDGGVLAAEASFHGRYLALYPLPFAPTPRGTRVQAFCQPGKHAFLPRGDLFQLLPGWFECCNENAGGRVLVGGPFNGAYASTPEDDARCRQYIRETFTFEPTLDFAPRDYGEALLPWAELSARIPVRVRAEMERLKNR